MVNESISKILKKQARIRPNNTILDFPDEEKSYTNLTLLQEVQAVERALVAKKIKKGDRIGVWLTNRSEWVLIALAGACTGIVVVPLNMGIRDMTLSHYIKKADIKLLFCSASYKNGLQLDLVNQYKHQGEIKGLEMVQLDGRSNDAHSWEKFLKKGTSSEIELPEENMDLSTNWLIQFTSGTTGFPKGVYISQYSALNVANAYGEVVKLSMSDTVLQVLPYFHCIGSIMGLLSSMLFDAKTIVLSRFSPERTNILLDKNQCTVMLGVPTMYFAMMRAENFADLDVSPLRILGIGGAGCQSELFDEIAESFPRSVIMCAYGLTETSSMIIAPDIADDYRVRRETVGHPIDGIKIKISGNKESGGELLVKGFSITKGYVDDEEKTNKLIDRDGWLHTGDVATIKKGNVKIIGRLDDMIEKGGEKISPKEIETALGVALTDTNVCVAGVADKKYGEEIIAFVECGNGRTVGSISDRTTEIFRILSGKIMSFEIPKYVAFVPTFPTTSNGKVVRSKLREMYLKKELIITPLRVKETA